MARVSARPKHSSTRRRRACPSGRPRRRRQPGKQCWTMCSPSTRRARFRTRTASRPWAAAASCRCGPGLCAWKVKLADHAAARCALCRPENKHVAFSCSLAASVHLIAVVHVTVSFGRSAAQVLPEAYKRFAAKSVRSIYTPLGEGAEWPRRGRRTTSATCWIGVIAVDALRNACIGPSQYAEASGRRVSVSRPARLARRLRARDCQFNSRLLACLRSCPARGRRDMWDLAEYANPPFDAAADGRPHGVACRRTAPTNCVSANHLLPGAHPPRLRRARLPLKILCGTVPRFYLGELRRPKGKTMSTGGTSFWSLSASSFGAAALPLVHVQPRGSTIASGRMGGNHRATGRAASPSTRGASHDQQWLGILIWLQFGYPIVSTV